MTTGLYSGSENWILPSNTMTIPSTLPNYEEAPPFRVNREGVKNYIKNQGSLNIGDWAVEGRRMSTSSTTVSNAQETNQPQPKVFGADALRNSTKSRASTPNLICGNTQTPDSGQGLRVRQEGRANYERNRNSEMKSLLENYGKLPLPTPTVPHTQGEVNLLLLFSFLNNNKKKKLYYFS